MVLAGTVVRNVTPPLGYRLHGHEIRQGLSDKVHDPLFLKALSLSDGRSRLAVVTADLLYFTPDFAAAVKQDAQRELGLGPEQVLLTAGHIHTGPFMFAAKPEDLRHMAPGYLDSLRLLILAALREAGEREESVSLKWGRAATDIGVINRRLMTPNGVEMRPNPAGPVDRDVLTLGAYGRDGRPRALLFNYACHPTTIATTIAQVSADYPGAAQRALEKRYPGAVALFVNGCCGDVRPNLTQNGWFRGGSFEEAERMGVLLADAASDAIERSEPVGDGPLAGRLETVALPLDAGLLPETPEKLERAAARHLGPPRRDEAGSGPLPTPADEKAVADWKAEMAARLARHDMPCATLPMDVQALAVGDVRLVGLAGEIMVEIGARLKAAAGLRTLIGSCANGVLGYFPTAAALAEGGYEARSFLQRDFPGPYAASAERVLMDKALALIRSLE